MHANRARPKLETDPIRTDLAICAEELLRQPKEREKGEIRHSRREKTAARVPKLRETDFGRIGAESWRFEAARMFYAVGQRGRSTLIDLLLFFLVVFLLLGCVKPF